jgi:Tfp pilus assembly PilM family ATPase
MLHFLKGQPFALEITDHHLRLMQLKGHEKKYEMIAKGQQEMPAGAIANGEILQPEILQEQLEKLFSDPKLSPLQQSECLVSIPETQIYRCLISIPFTLKGPLLKNAIEDELQKKIPLPLEEIKYHSSMYNLDDSLLLAITASPKNLLNKYKVSLENAKLKPVAFEPEAISLLRNFEINPDQNYLIIVKLGNNFNWYLLWGNIIFDSNTLSAESEEKLKDLLSRDLKKSIAFFESETKSELSHTYIISSQEEFLPWSENLSKEFGFPLIYFKDSKAPSHILPEDEPEWITLKGLALGGLKSNFHLNLLK